MPSLRRRQEGKSKYECELIKGIALMRSLQFAKFIWKIDVDIVLSVGGAISDILDYIFDKSINNVIWKFHVNT